MPQIVAVQVDGLLGRFNHHIRFPSEWEFVIIHGPNGVGKTKFLELISATCAFQVRVMAAIPFSFARMNFDDGTELRVTRTPVNEPKTRRRGPRVSSQIHFDLRRANARPVVWTSGGHVAVDRRQLIDYLVAASPISPVGEDQFHDHANGDLIDFEEAFQRYGDLLPEKMRDKFEEFPKEIKQFLSECKVYLIETQRLLNLREERGVQAFGQVQRNREQPTTRVSHYSEDLTRRLREALAQNSRRSQELDRTFPGRLLQGESPVGITDELILEEYNRQAEYRGRLADIDVLGTSSEYLPLPDRALQPWERRVMWTYLQDTERKLDTFRGLLDRVQLLQEIVNSRFKYKNLSISRERGFVITADDTGHEISPDKLSSGEQHELVLVYGLLFQVEEGTLVLIDEPEISLHVGWQRQFLQDLFSIARVTSLRFVIATHSPQIIHKWWDRATPLVPEDEMDN